MVDALLHFAKTCRRIRKDILDAVHFAVEGHRHGHANIKFTAFQLNRQLDSIMDTAHNRLHIAIAATRLDIMQHNRKNVGTDTCNRIPRTTL